MTSPAPEPTAAGDQAFGRWLAARDRAAADADARLVTDLERDGACGLLNEAFGDGRLTAPELEERTSRALAARTHGDLQAVLAGLTDPGTSLPWAPPSARGLLPRVVFWIVGIMTSPFVFLGAMLLLFGSDAGDRVFGTVLLVIFLPGVIALYRWAHPRS